jgi:hypothetical protein
MSLSIPRKQNGSSALKDRLSNPARYTAVSIIILLFFAHSFYLGGYLTDDAFITFRYARNLAAGFGPVFNAGERVEGYTSFGWMIIFALIHYLGIEPVTISRALGLFLGAATLVICFRFMSRRRANASLVISCIPLIFLALNSGFALWARGGMETLLFAFLVSWAAFSTLDKKMARALTGSLYALAFLVRPEGLLFFALALLYILYESRSTREAIKFAAPIFLILVPYQIWRMSFYGALLPNTFYAKTTNGPELISAGFDYLCRAFTSFRLGLFLLPFLASFIEAPSRRISAFFLWLALPYCAYVIYAGGDWMPMFRFVIPLLPMYYVAASIGMADLLEKDLSFRSTKYACLFWIAFIAIAGSLTFEYSVTRRTDLIENYHGLLRDKRIGLWLAENVPGDTRIALGVVGVIPYYSRLETIDIWGITNADIARQTFKRNDIHSPGHVKYNAQLVLSKDTDIIIINTHYLDAANQKPYPQNPADQALFDHPAFSSRYRPASVRLGDNFYFCFYINKSRAGKIHGILAE